MFSETPPAFIVFESMLIDIGQTAILLKRGNLKDNESKL